MPSLVCPSCVSFSDHDLLPSPPVSCDCVSQVVTVNPTTTKTPILHTANTQLLQDFDNLGERAMLEYGTQYR